MFHDVLGSCNGSLKSRFWTLCSSPDLKGRTTAAEGIDTHSAHCAYGPSNLFDLDLIQ